MSCDVNACKLCLGSMTAVENTVCNAADDAMNGICSGLSDASDDDPFAAFLALVACGSAANVGCTTVMEYKFDSSVCAAMFSGGCCGSAPPVVCSACPQDCQNAAAIVQGLVDNGPSGAQTVCAPLYGSNCSNLVTLAQNTLQSSTGNSFRTMGDITDALVSANGGPANACSTCQPGCVTMLSQSLSPPASPTVYGANVGAMYQAVQNAATALGSTLQFTKWVPWTTYEYVGIGSSGETNNAISLGISSVVSAVTSITPSASGTLQVSLGGQVSFSVNQTFSVQGNYSISAMTVNFVQNPPSISTTPIVPSTSFVASMQIQYGVNFIMSSDGSYFTAVMPQIIPNKGLIDQVQVTLSGISQPSGISPQTDINVVLTDALLINMPWVGQSVPLPASGTTLVSPYCLSTGSYTNAVLSQSGSQQIWTGLLSPACAQTAWNEMIYTGLFAPNASGSTDAATYNYQPLTQMSTVLNFVMMSQAHLLNATRGSDQATYVLVQGWDWANSSAWGVLGSPQPIAPRKPAAAPSGDSTYLLSAGNIVYQVAVSQTGLITAVPTTGQPWTGMWNKITLPALQQLKANGAAITIAYAGANSTSPMAQFTYMYPSQPITYTLTWANVQTDVVNVNVQVSGTEQPVSWTLGTASVNGTLSQALTQWLPSLLQFSFQSGALFA